VAERVDLPAGVQALAARFSLPEQATTQLACLAERLVADPLAPTAVREVSRVLDDHLADSLVALSLPELGGVRTLADLGSGAGLPGLPLAIALPEVAVTLIESSSRTCDFLEATVAACGLRNVAIDNRRAEEAGRAAGRFDAVTARALASLAVVAEYAAPLLVVGGVLLVWRGQRDVAAEREAERAAGELGLAVGEVHRVQPYPAAQRRHLHVFPKVSDTPPRFPRRPGMAVKRPLGR
jgi:16S rRNA (guanine527-N7)-methyltransferase